MLKYYIALFLAAGVALYYVFLQDPCGQLVKADFSSKFSDYEILSTGASEGSTESVLCHISYLKPDSQQVSEDVWMYKKSAEGWAFSRIVKTAE